MCFKYILYIALYSITMKRLLLLLTAIAVAPLCFAQLLTWTPPFPVENDPAQNLVITVDATKGNQGLMNHTPADDVYMHIGVITNLSTTTSDWKHVLTTWATQPVAFRADSVDINKWSFTIPGSLRSYFNVTDPSETILKIALLFRSGSGTKKQANTDGSDLFIPVYSNALAVRIEQPPFQPRFILTPEPQTWSVGTVFSFAGKSNKPATLTLYHNGAVAATASNAQSITTSRTVTAVGNQQLVLLADDGVTPKADTVNIFVAPVSSIAALPAGLRDGLNYEPGDTSVTLVLHAPGKSFVTVVGEFNNWVQDTAYLMKKTPDGLKFWYRLKGLTPGTEYAFQYRVDDTIRITDPYVEKVLDPFNDPFITSSTYPALKPYPAGQTGIVGIIQTAAPAYTWTVNNFTRPNKRNLVIYELLIRDFVGKHDFNTLLDSLDYLKKLGINAIELMPVNEFEGNLSWGYNPNYYFAPDKYYGPANTFKKFIDSCHRKGIAVIMDIAFNHQFGSSPLVQLYWDKALNRPATNNPWFNPVPKHAYNVGYDMNHESLDTRNWTSRVIEHWLTNYKIDGFRFDLSKGMTQTQTCDNNGGNCNEGAMFQYDQSRINILKRYYDTMQLKAPGSIGILEHFADNNEEMVLSDYGMLLWGNNHYNWEEAAKGNINNSNFDGAIASVRGWSKPHLVSYMESHDEERIAYGALTGGRTGPGYNIRDTATAMKRMELNAAFFLMIPGPKMIWQFGELGYHFPINLCENGTIDNGCRLSPKPIRWDFLNDPRRKSIHTTYTKLINLRHDPAFTYAFTNGVVERSLSSSFKWMRVTGDTNYIVVVGNFDIVPVTGSVAFQLPGVWTDHLAGTTFNATGALQQMTLQPGEFHVYTLHATSVVAVPGLRVSGTVIDARAYPNPARTHFKLDLYLPESGNTEIELINNTGQSLGYLKQGFLQRGEHTIQVPAQKLAKGSYYVKIKNRSGVKLVAIILQ
jgi:1,4-alpha-glucan branching enzyme